MLGHFLFRTMHCTMGIGNNLRAIYNNYWAVKKTSVLACDSLISLCLGTTQL